MDLAAHGNDAILGCIVTEIGRLECRKSDRFQSLFGPLSEEVDRAIVDERGKVSEARVEDLAHVDIRANTLDEVRVESNLREGEVEGLADGPHTSSDAINIVVIEKVGHVSRVEEVVDVLKKGLLDNLSVISPLILAIRLGYLDLEAIRLGHSCGEARERLTPRAANAKQKGIPTWLTDDARYAGDVAHSIYEHDKRHLLGMRCVVIFKTFLDDGHHFACISYLTIYASLGTRYHEVSVEQVRHLDLNDIVPGNIVAEDFRNEAFEHAVKPCAVVVVDEAIPKNTQVFMCPDSAEVRWLEDGLGVGIEHALDDSGQVAHVERVVRLRWCRKQLFEKSVDQSKDGLHRGILELWKCDEIEVAEEAIAHDLPPAARWTHRADKRDVDDLPELPRLAFIPAAMPHPLAQNLYRRLSTIFLALRHIDIVNEDDVLFARWRPIDSLTPLVNLGINLVLRHVGGRLGGEANEDGAVVVGHASHELVDDVQRLPRAGGPDSQDHPHVTHRIQSRHDDVLESNLRRERECGDRLHPPHPLLVLENNGHVVDERLGQTLAEINIECCTGGCIGGCPCAPNHREDDELLEQLWQGGRKLFGHLVASLDGYEVRPKGGENVERRRHQIVVDGRHIFLSTLSHEGKDASASNQPSICASVPTTFSGSMKIVPTRETVAGDATARSSTSNIMVMYGDMAMISPDERQIFLLSSRTVFIDSIHKASTGPSKTIHCLSVESCSADSLTAARYKIGMMPSVHSCVFSSNWP
eukprot:scaffold15484_cov30-Tisochrysis_lutea.AAC.4